MAENKLADLSMDFAVNILKITDGIMHLFFIQAAGLVYHCRAKCGVYHRAQACISMRLDERRMLIASYLTLKENMK